MQESVREVKKNGFSCGILKTLKVIDIYGKRIQLTYRGKESFKTVPGVIVTLLLVFLVIVYALVNIQQLRLRLSPKLSKQDLQRNLNTAGPLDLFSLGFDIAFGLGSEIDPSLVYLSAQHANLTIVDWTKDENEDIIPRRESTVKDIQLTRCQQERFNYSNWTEASFMNLGNYYCFSQKDYQLEGNYFNEKFQYIAIKLNRCKNSSESQIICKSKEEIDSFLSSGLYLNFVMLNSYFDVQEYETPIKKYLDNTIIYQTVNHSNKKLNLFLEKNLARLKDDQYMIEDEKQIEFLSFSKSFLYDSGNEDALFSLFLRYGSGYETFRREVYTVLDWLGDVGGLEQMLYLIGFALVYLVSTKYFEASLINKLYQLSDKNTANSKSVLLKLEQPESRLDDFSIKQIFKTITSRKSLKLTSKDIAGSFLKCILCRNYNKIKGKASLSRQYHFLKAQKQLYRELDIFQIIKSNHYQKVFRSIMFKDYHKLLLKFQRLNVVETSQSESSSENEDETLDLINDKNPMMRNAALNEVSTLLQQLQQRPLKALDKNTVKGVFLKNVKSKQAHPLFRKKTFIEKARKESIPFVRQNLKNRSTVRRETDENDSEKHRALHSEIQQMTKKALNKKKRYF